MYKRATAFTALMILSAVITGKLVYGQPLDPNIVALSSTIVPGSGYYLLGEYEKGGLSSIIAIPMIAYYYIPATTPENGRLGNAARVASLYGYLYGIYDSYTDAMVRSGVSIEKYRLSELMASLFDRRTYQTANDTEAGLLFGCLFTPLVSSCIQSVVSERVDFDTHEAPYAITLIPFQSLLFAAAEEAYWRGTVYPVVSELTGSALAGNIVQALYFGFIHTSWARKIGFSAFPQGLGALLTLTATNPEIKEPRTVQLTPFGNEWLTFGLLSAEAFLWGLLADQTNGLLKATAAHYVFTVCGQIALYIINGTSLL